MIMNVKECRPAEPCFSLKSFPTHTFTARLFCLSPVCCCHWDADYRLCHTKLFLQGKCLNSYTYVEQRLLKLRKERESWQKLKWSILHVFRNQAVRKSREHPAAPSVKSFQENLNGDQFTVAKALLDATALGICWFNLPCTETVFFWSTEITCFWFIGGSTLFPQLFCSRSGESVIQAGWGATTGQEWAVGQQGQRAWGGRDFGPGQT